MKIYGNAKSDGFSMFLTATGAVFVVGGFLLNTVGGMTFLATFPLFLVVAFAMIKVVGRWDVMSDAASPAAAATMPTFPVKADTEATWTPANDTVLPSPVDKPKAAIETNTAVAA